jgi:N-ethylmaleimide reductase
MSSEILKPIKLGTWHLRNRIVMAPMTRCFADDQKGTVGNDVVEYYRKRAADGIGLIITEGIIVSPSGKGTFNLPGIYTKEQAESWKKVTEAVHNEGGTIIAQLWHVGRLTHHEILGGTRPLAPSAIKAKGHVHRFGKPFDLPKEMTIAEIQEMISFYAQAAYHAKTAGFDGVEIHGAHGYLIDQFNSEVSNCRTDRYGGELAERLTFMKEVLQAVIREVGADETMIRFSALKDDYQDYMWEDPETAIKTFIDVFKEAGISTIHPSTNQFSQIIADGKTLHELVRKHWDKQIIGVGNLNPESANTAIKNSLIDLVAFGRPILANPDFVSRITEGRELATYQSKEHLPVLR